MNNSITLVGHVGQAPQEHKFTSEFKLAKFSIAAKEFSHNDEDKTLWLDIPSWNGMAGRVLSVVAKGRQVVVVGRLPIDQYDRKRDDGITGIVSKPIIRLSLFHLCNARPKSNCDAASKQKTKAKQPAKAS